MPPRPRAVELPCGQHGMHRRGGIIPGRGAAPPLAAPRPPPRGYAPLAASNEILTRVTLIGNRVLNRWPVEGWVQGTVSRGSRAPDSRT